MWGTGKSASGDQLLQPVKDRSVSGIFYLCSEAIMVLAAAGQAEKLMLPSGSLGCNDISESRCS